MSDVAANLVIEGGLVWRPDDGGWRSEDVHIRDGRFDADPAPDRGDVQTVSARDRLVIPGLVNAHTHAHNNLLKGTGDCRYLEGHINAMSAVGSWSPRDLYLSTMVGAIEMLKSGTTTAYDMVRAPTDAHVEACVQAYDDAGMRAVIAPAISDAPFVDAVPGLVSMLTPETVAALRAAGPPPRSVALEFAERSVRSWNGAGGGRIQISIGPLIADVCSDDLLADVAGLADDLGVGTHMHLLESKTQALQGLVRGRGLPWVSHLSDLGYLRSRSTFAHAVWLTDPEVALLADHGSTVVHNPASNLKLGSGLAPVFDYRRLGLTVALATDGAASGDSLNMFGAMWLVGLLNHSRSPDPSEWLSASDVLELATSASDRALGLSGRIGAVVPGAIADLVIVDPQRAGMTPLNDPTTQLVYADAGAAVERVIVDGRVVVDEGGVVGIDEEDILAEAREAANRLDLGVALTGPHAELQASLDVLQGGLRGKSYPVNRYTG